MTREEVFALLQPVALHKFLDDKDEFDRVWSALGKPKPLRIGPATATFRATVAGLKIEFWADPAWIHEQAAEAPTC